LRCLLLSRGGFQNLPSIRAGHFNYVLDTSRKGFGACEYVAFEYLCVINLHILIGRVAVLKSLTHRPFVPISATSDLKAGILSVEGNPSTCTKRHSQSFERNDSPPTYDVLEKPVENYTWSGPVGEAILRMNSGEDVSITESFEMPRSSSSLIRGTSTRITGNVKCDGSRLLGTFYVDGSPRYLTVDIKPLNQSFECGSAILTYYTADQLTGDCKWVGTVGKDDLEMNFGGGVSIKGLLVTARPSSIRIHGAGLWNTFEVTLPPLSDNTVDELRSDGSDASTNQFPTHSAVRDPAKLQRERQLLESGAPIIAYVQSRFFFLAAC